MSSKIVRGMVLALALGSGGAALSQDGEVQTKQYDTGGGQSYPLFAGQAFLWNADVHTALLSTSALPDRQIDGRADTRTS